MTTNVLIVPGYHGSGEAHWQSWLQARLPHARRVDGIDWETPALFDWAQAIILNLARSSAPTILVAHSFGCLASALAIAHRPQSVAGAILVAPADPERFGVSGTRDHSYPQADSIARFLPERRLEIRGLMVGSRNDPWMKLPHAHAWATRWGLSFHDAGAVGHINTDSGFGPWPWIEQLTEALGNRIIQQRPVTHWQHRSYRYDLINKPIGAQRLLYA
ncbi:hypothetical protein GCM10007972_27550 [Iodidimonas muriae]|uniref:Alpha/beta hydrolase n=1 Tax=Iodidimonas muriae TaxID=261467 RepID=A0ABQ2LGF4_9PROT|nr:alpha/beta hydrolase [Iodidimonas muriae]GER08756.1 hypothetical protein JCM17843_30660 [Kordiimonadales bacterium JCM 17843]GGO17459.1 hypothetical protein GCM10007972_27550 [Iodidimonas muriae]